MLTVISAQRTERIPEAEFDRNPEVDDGWEEIARKDGFVYIGFNRELAKKQRDERLANVLSLQKQSKNP